MGLMRFLRNLFSRQADAKPAPFDPTATLRVQPAHPVRREPTPKAAAANDSFVRRDAILNRAEQIAGYEFSLNTRLKVRMTRRGGIASRAYDTALLTRLELHEAASLLGSRLALICLSIESLTCEAIDRLPRANTVLVFDLAIQSGDWTTQGTDLAAVKRKGYTVGIRVADIRDLDCPLLAMIDFVLVDTTAFDGIELRNLARKLKSPRPDGSPPPRVVAGDIQGDDDYQHCYKCGFDLFQGPFLAGNTQLRPTRTTINRAAALSVLNMLRTDQSYAAIAEQLKNEPTLSYKLLRYLGSAAVGMQKPTNSLTEALVVLGRDKFYRWTSLLLFDFDNPGYQEHLLAERALTRGKALELLAGKGRIPALPEQLFLIGLFSLLDRAFDQPLTELVDKAALPEAVREALLGQPGPLTDALALVKLDAVADAPPEDLARALDACGINDDTYAHISMAALVWADQMLNEQRK